MKNLLRWLRSLVYTEPELTEFDIRHYKNFERAVEESDVEAYLYDEHIKGNVIVLKGEDLHQVTPNNLVSFRKLNRRERRILDNKYNAHLARGKTNEEDHFHLRE